MTGRHLGCALLLSSATILLCCNATGAEEGPILPGLDAIPQSPPYVADPSGDATPRPRRNLRPARPPADVEREPSPAHDGAEPPVRRGETAPDAQAPNAKRSGIRGLLPERPADRPPLTRSLDKPDANRANPLGRALDAPRSAPGKPSDAMSKRRNPSDPRSPERAAIGDRREPLADPWGANRQPTDPRARAALEREKAWRAGQNTAPSANARSPRAGSTAPQQGPQQSPPRAPQAGRQPGKQAPPSPRTGQPSGNRMAR